MTMVLLFVIYFVFPSFYGLFAEHTKHYPEVLMTLYKGKMY